MVVFVAIVSQSESAQISLEENKGAARTNQLLDP